MYKYFVPEEPDGENLEFVGDKVPSAHSRGDIVPLYDEDGRFPRLTTFNLLL